MQIFWSLPVSNSALPDTARPGIHSCLSTCFFLSVYLPARLSLPVAYLSSSRPSLAQSSASVPGPASICVILL